MTVADLIKLMSEMPQDATVMVSSVLEFEVGEVTGPDLSGYVWIGEAK